MPKKSLKHLIPFFILISIFFGFAFYYEQEDCLQSYNLEIIGSVKGKNENISIWDQVPLDSNQINYLSKKYKFNKEQVNISFDRTDSNTSVFNIKNLEGDELFNFILYKDPYVASRLNYFLASEYSYKGKSYNLKKLDTNAHLFPLIGIEGQIIIHPSPGALKILINKNEIISFKEGDYQNIFRNI